MDHPHLRSRRLGATTLLIVVAMVLGACSNTSSRALVGTTTSTAASAPSDPSAAADAPAGIQPPPGWKLPDTRNAVLLAAPSKAKAAPIPVVGGHATITGTVSGPDGPVPGATVRIERFVGTTSGSTQVTADGGGHFVLPGALGGRYRVRAWLQPDLATFNAPTGFVADGDSLDLSPGLERHNAVTLQLAATQATLSIGAAGGVRALLTRETVDSNGIVQAAGVAATSIQLLPGDGLAVTSTNPGTTDGGGSASWVVQCLALGAHDVGATVAGVAASATVVCTDAAPTTTTTSPAPTTTAPGKTTTTTRPTGPGH